MSNQTRLRRRIPVLALLGLVVVTGIARGQETGSEATASAVEAAAATAGEGEVLFWESIIHWESIRGNGDPAMYEAYLAQFPNGMFASLARLRLSELEPE